MSKLLKPALKPAAESASKVAPKLTTAGDGSPKFGRLLIALVLAVMLIGVITLAAEAYYS
jgi:hypothetical protein